METMNEYLKKIKGILKVNEYLPSLLQYKLYEITDIAIAKQDKLKGAILRDIVPCGAYINQRFGGKYHLHKLGRTTAE
jgi:hypothetical protein